MATESFHECSWVLLPGTLCTGAVFDGFLDGLNVPDSSRQVVLLDRPGVEDYLEDLERLTDANTIICGFSLGAIVAAHLADRLSASRFLLFGLNPYADDPLKREGRLALARDVRQQGGAAALATRLQPMAGRDPVAARALVLSMADDSTIHIDAQTELALSRPGALEHLAGTSVPVTVLTGSDDGQAPLTLARAAAEVAPQGSLIQIPGLGHYALLEDPRTCSRYVLQS
ncbi:alpha/beta fold hydrolase [Granulosicoccus sp. 3-233]|uniref:alpha/beta fold hydrolase n=1 Tax=Granulosicoccus sp. 3-233 TaxID=3417969 RepID=UPI003D33E7CE